MGKARALYAGEDFGLDIRCSVYALDSTTVDLSLTLFSLGRFPQNRSGDQAAYADRFERTYSHVRFRLGCPSTQRPMARPVGVRSRSILRGRSRLHGLHAFGFARSGRRFLRQQS